MLFLNFHKIFFFSSIYTFSLLPGFYISLPKYKGSYHLFFYSIWFLFFFHFFFSSTSSIIIYFYLIFISNLDIILLIVCFLILFLFEFCFQFHPLTFDFNLFFVLNLVSIPFSGIYFFGLFFYFFSISSLNILLIENFASL